MKKEYKDLGVDEKKEYWLLNNGLESSYAPYVAIFTAILLITTSALIGWCSFAILCALFWGFFRDWRKLRDLWGLNRS